MMVCLQDAVAWMVRGVHEGNLAVGWHGVDLEKMQDEVKGVSWVVVSLQDAGF